MLDTNDFQRAAIVATKHVEDVAVKQAVEVLVLCLSHVMLDISSDYETNKKPTLVDDVVKVLFADINRREPLASKVCD